MANDHTEIIEAFDSQLFQARLHFDLRHNRLNSENWEKLIAACTGSTWVKGSAHLADAVNKQMRRCISVKTRAVEPHIRKQVENRDFLTHPAHFHLGGEIVHELDLDNLHTVSRRCSIPELDEQGSPAEAIGKAAIADYIAFEQASLDKFGCDGTIDVVVLHGRSADNKRYLARVMFFDHKLNDIQSWYDVTAGDRSKYSGKRMMIVGNDAKGPHLGRNSNLGRQQTCMFRFYRMSEAIKVLEFQIPMPKQEKFDLEKELKLMK